MTTGDFTFYAPQLHRQVLLRARISCGKSVRPSVLPSVRLSGVSRPGAESRPGQTETPYSLARLTDRYRHNKHCRRAFRWYQHRWPWTTLNPQNVGFKLFYAILGYDAHLQW